MGKKRTEHLTRCHICDCILAQGREYRNHIDRHDADGEEKEVGLRAREINRAIETIDRLAGDDFCEELSMNLAAGRLDGRLKLATEKLLEIYRLAHGHNRATACFAVHADWRCEAPPRDRT